MEKRSKALEEIWKQVPPDYYQTGVKKNLFQWIWHTWKWNSMKSFFNSLDPLPTKILDIGCASGFLTSQIANFFVPSDTFGVDSYKQAVEFGKKTYPDIKFKYADAHKLPFKNESFDLITCIETLEHLENPKGAISEMHRCLKNKGRVLIGQDTDNLLFKIIWMIWTKRRGKVWHNSHLHPYSPKRLEKLIKECGLQIIKKRFSHLGMEVFFLIQKKEGFLRK